MSKASSHAAEELQPGHDAYGDSNIQAPAPPRIKDDATHGHLNKTHYSFSSATRELNGSTGTTVQWNANYIAPTISAEGRRTSSPAEATAGARSGEEILRRISLAAPSSNLPQVAALDPRAMHPGLDLSGNVISATFCVPYKINYASGGEWVCPNFIILRVLI